MDVAGNPYDGVNVPLPAPPLLTKGSASMSMSMPASLRRVRFDYYNSILDSHLHLILQWHAATLEDVCIMGDTPRAATLLSALPALHTLKCPLLKGMLALLQCPSLKKLALILDLNAWTRPLMSEAEELVRRAATRLEELTLDYNQEKNPAAEAVNLVLCLGADAAPTSLRSLAFVLADSDVPPPVLPPLAAVLHRLPLLTSLDVNCKPPDAFLRALDGKVVPALTKLEVWLKDDEDEWLDSEPVQTVYERYPELEFWI
ncbi:uncharacterized protein LOC117647370 [Thrips palmi]|uniref:Uncharacterized protein LOC117647370 n=1 Tax=Thrips palmi TaxID=161013 RepID=A0A6P8ZPZ9_THRPL|nr:uncharacterized protein LOC117647370 [Thrips palmi]